ncbi:DUF1569 domain-containing protein [Pseudomonas sp. N040]|uniref:DUF1569 domain-containing protein n=1 Tax=Pseudomonas sp. N040 TaxID=2785325 RepID=UPI0018A2ACAD|nr:DUF1569 domain-containing protein [Pseudomonas sp. N040]MBF7729627.1 DUF1569 domain-containing protein [Pseudomonas sp. N040]MBW7013267.1 DUF1569 domain-containing protein [Pseudomonas sp. N040]
MRRRQLLGVMAGLSAAALGTAWWALPGAPAPAALSLAAARQLLQQLAGQALRSEQGWTPAEVFNHCAQSVDYSMDGYPQLKPAWFRHSLGPAVFDLFAARGAMRHPLAEPIPGAPPLAEPATADAALQRLQLSLQRFATFGGPLQPHFAYGELSHAEYALAHVLHLYNHLELIRPA